MTEGVDSTAESRGDARTDLRRERLDGTSYLVGGTGPTVVFLHGIPGSAETWRSVASSLTDRFHVVVPDLRGFGHSAPPTDDYYLDAQADAVAALLAGLGVEDCSLVAHDFGGPVAVTLLQRAPDRHVSRLVLSATNLFTDTHVPPPLRLAGVPLLGDLVFRLFVGNRLGLRLLYRQAVVRRETFRWRDFRRHLTRSGVSFTRRIFQRSLADLPGNYGAVEASLATLDCPVLVLWGDEDPFFAVAVGERTADAIPDADLQVVTGTGHFVPEECPDEVAAAVGAFLSG